MLGILIFIKYLKKLTSPFIREATCCDGQSLRRRVTVVKVLRICNFGVLSPKWGISPSHRDFRRQLVRETDRLQEPELRTRRWETMSSGLNRQLLSWTHNCCWWLHKTCGDQDSEHSNKCEGAHQAPIRAESYWQLGNGNQLSSGVWPLIACTPFGKRCFIHTHRDSNAWTLGVVKNQKTRI